MKKVMVFLMILFLAGFASAEMIINGDFELGAWSSGGSGSGGSPAWAWQAFPPVFQTDGGGSDGGNWTLLDTSSAPWTGGWNWAWSGIWQDGSFPAVAGDEFTISGMAKHISEGTTLRLFIAYEDATGTRVDYDGDGDVDNDDRYKPTWTTGAAWAAFSDTFTVPSLDLLGGTFTSPIAQFGVTFSVEAEKAAVGIDEISLLPAGDVRVVDPLDGVTVATSQSSLTWERDPIMAGSLKPDVEVWWGDADANDVSFWSKSTKIMNLADTDSLLLSAALGGAITLAVDEEYLWALKYEDPALGPLLLGPVWGFDTINLTPVVDAGGDSDVWLDSGGSVTVPLDAGFSDDGIPAGTPTPTWSSVPSGGVSFAAGGGDPEDQDVTFTAAGDYTLTLSVDDGLAIGTDTARIRVFAYGDNRLRVHYKFDGDATDSDKNSFGGVPDDDHPGTAVGGPLWPGAAGQVGGAVLLDGVDDYIEIGDTGSDPNFQPDSWENADLVDGMTISVWVKLNWGWSITWESIVAKDTNAWELLRAGDADSIALGIKGGVGSASSSSNQLISDGQWHHVVGVFDRSTIKLYVDGYLEQTTQAGADIMPKTTGKIRIGATNSGGIDYNVHALIDEVRIYDAAIPYISNDYPTNPGIRDIFREDGGHGCGGLYAVSDVDEDCYSDLGDFAVLIGGFMDCTDIANPNCN